MKSSSNLNKETSGTNVSQIMRKLTKGTKQWVSKNQTAISQDSITPKNRISTLNNTISKFQPNRKSDQFYTNQRSFGTNFTTQIVNGGSVTNRDNSGMRNQKEILKGKLLPQKPIMSLNLSKYPPFRNSSLNKTINSSRDNSQTMRQAT